MFGQWKTLYVEWGCNFVTFPPHLQPGKEIIHSTSEVSHRLHAVIDINDHSRVQSTVVGTQPARKTYEL